MVSDEALPQKVALHEALPQNQGLMEHRTTGYRISRMFPELKHSLQR
jgi:hypothetical protein